MSYGRRRALIFATILQICICFLMLVQNYYVFLVGRLLMGFCIGIRIVGAMRMVEEYNPQKFFATMANLMYASIALGAIVTASFPYSNEQAFIQHWRWVFGA